MFWIMSALLMKSEVVVTLLMFCVHSATYRNKRWKNTGWKYTVWPFPICRSSFFSLSGGQQKEIIVSKSDPKVVIKDYSPRKDYTVSVIAVSGSEQSRPLNGRYKGVFHFLQYTCRLFIPLYLSFPHFLVSRPFLNCSFLIFTAHIRDDSVVIWKHAEDMTVKYDIFLGLNKPTHNLYFFFPSVATLTNVLC